MFSFAPWLPTALAIALAIVAALCFAYAASLQQHAVTETVHRRDGVAAATQPGVSITSFHALAQQPRWLGGWGLMAAASALHVSALLLAPISVVQPIGILAVPVAVILAARSRRSRPPAAAVAGVVLSVAGMGTFVLLAGHDVTTSSGPTTLVGLLTALLIVVAAVFGLTLIARRSSRLIRCFAYAGIGAVSFGCSSALIRLISQAVAAEAAAFKSPLVIVAGLAVVAALTCGAWAVQQAYVSGSAAIVVSILTLGDPLVAILLGGGLLGEGLSQNPAINMAMVGSAIAASYGVRLLAAHHPAAAPRLSPESAPAPARTLASVR